MYKTKKLVLILKKYYKKKEINKIPTIPSPTKSQYKVGRKNGNFMSKLELGIGTSYHKFRL